MRKERISFYVLFALLTGCIVMFSFTRKPIITFKNGPLRSDGDTTSFIANKAAGWNILSSYLNQDTEDSVEFELILKQNSFLGWGRQQFVGTITNKLFLPKTDQKLNYDLYKGDTWSLIVTASGECYLYHLVGFPLIASSLQGNPFVLPVKVRYKNN